MLKQLNRRSRGPYRFMRHPNYAVTVAETLLLSLAFGAPWLGIIFAVVWATCCDTRSSWRTMRC
jgi:methyltransferase